ncbi:MAG: type V CRISPR-associated protein Cas12a/Cpf1 [Bacteroidaceae bacterium]|nr:type V CRISPR-associated protein Cas12a/Cpf1 [Bacteroidaceae bacterium]
METLFENFTNLYSLSKTLRFELKPVFNSKLSKEEKTVALDKYWSQYLNSEIFKHDDERDKSYPVVKSCIDIFHKRFIKDSLSRFESDKWERLSDLYREDKKGKEYKDLQKEIRTEIADNFKKHEWWQYVDSYSKLIVLLTDLLKTDDDFRSEAMEKVGEDVDNILEHLDRFKHFSLFFETLKKNRDNMYSKDAKATSIANRLVNENFCIFVDNIAIYNRLYEVCPKELEVVEKNLSSYLNGLTFKEIFTPSYYNKCLTQNGIEVYNWLLGANPNQEVLGINSIGNEYLQKNPNTGLRLKDLRMNKLYKQILSERERFSFIPEQFSQGTAGEKQLVDAIDSFVNCANGQDLLGKAKAVFAQMLTDKVNLDNVYVSGKHISELSQMLYGNWNKLGEALRSKTTKSKKELEKDISEWIEKKTYSVNEILTLEKNGKLVEEHNISLADFIKGAKVPMWYSDIKAWKDYAFLDECNISYCTEFKAIKEKVAIGESIRENDDAKEVIKSFLDKWLLCLHCLEIFRVDDCKKEKDPIYYDYDALFETDDDKNITFRDIVPLYNKVRSFLTRKIKDEKKISLRFDCATLAKGWDENKENANNATILIDEGKYYLLILNPTNKPILDEARTGNGGFKKIVYHQIGNVAADIPNLMVENGKTVIKRGRKDENGENKKLKEYKKKLLPDDIYRIGDSGSYKRSSSIFNEYDLHKYVAYYMQRVIEYKNGEIEFHFKSPEEYDSYDAFLEDVSQQNFSLSFVDFDGEVVRQWIDDNKVMLFQISNKDFNENAHGTANMHTLYWKEIFSKRNLDDIVFQLNGETVKLYYRKNALKNPYVHKESSVLVNKTYTDGTIVQQEDYMAFLKYYNSGGDLTDKQKKLLPNVCTKKAKMDIVKDKRFAEHKFLFHVPITINFKSPQAPTLSEFNSRTIEILRRCKDKINIIGIDRGERNLIYVSVIDKNGNVIRDENGVPLIRDYNIIESKLYEDFVRKYNYLEKLKQVESDRDKARKNWDVINGIKDLKSGYLAQVVHEISKLVVKYNAIIVLEDLNYGFKRGRFNVERQVYQNFEKALIQKLNYLVFKTDAPSPRYGNVHNGLQLTAPFTSFKDLGKQSGWLFYVPAEYTSKIDAETGFVNLFNMKEAAKDPKNFFEAFKSIEYKNGLFYFKFDYSNNKLPTVKSDYTNNWTLASYGNRIKITKESGSSKFVQKEVVLNDEFKSVFSDPKHQLSLDKISKENIIKHDKSDSLCKDLFNAFKLLLQMRNSMSNSSIDYLISPVESEHPFVTGENNQMCIKDADANGAYHIALKGLYLIEHDFPVEKGSLQRISTSQWLEFVQTKAYRKNNV